MDNRNNFQHYTSTILRVFTEDVIRRTFWLYGLAWSGSIWTGSLGAFYK
jgi:hypothetical protein